MRLVVMTDDSGDMRLVVMTDDSGDMRLVVMTDDSVDMRLVVMTDDSVDMRLVVITDDSVDPVNFLVSPLGVSTHLSTSYSSFYFHIHRQFLNGVKPNERVVKCSWVKFK
jgi:hypothetical protein